MENEKLQIISFLIISELSHQPQTTFLCNRQTKKQNLLLAKSSRVCYCCNMQPNCFLDNTQRQVKCCYMQSLSFKQSLPKGVENICLS